MLKKPGIFTLLLVVTCVAFAIFAHAEENRKVTVGPVVITATRVAVPEEEVGKTVNVITAEELAQQRPTSLTNALRNVAGVRIQQLRGPGSLQTISIRGVGARYTQILVNGLPVRDASSVQGDAIAFMDDILVEDIERIEIVRGSSSTLYGSDSIGGTINIITKKGTEIPEYFASFEGGSLSTFQEVVGARGKSGVLDYSLTAKRVDSDGIDDHDDYTNTSLAGQFGFDFSDNVSLRTHLKYSDASVDLNSSPVIENGVLVKDQDDPDDTQDKTLFSGGVALTQQVSERLDYSLKVGYVDTERKLKAGPDGDEFGFGNVSTFTGNTLNAELQTNYSLNDTNLLTLGYEYEAEEIEQDLGDRKDTPDATRNAVYFQDSLALMDETFNIVPGIRYMDHDQAGDRVDWEVSASYMLEEAGIRVHGHIGTGFRAPSLYELYGASVFGGEIFEFGNADLDPEESLGYDIGVEFKVLEEALLFDVTYFTIDFDKMIIFGTNGYENSDGGESQGVEFELRYSPTTTLTLTGSYTYTDAEDADGETLTGVNEHEFGLALNYRFLEKFTANLVMTTKSGQDTPLFDPTTFKSAIYEEDGYTKVDVVLDYTLSNRLQLWTRIDNLFDEDFTENGFQTPGMSVYGGVKMTL